MIHTHTLKLLSILIIFALILTACGDDPASVDEDPPEFPEFENLTVDISYFNNVNTTESPAYDASMYASSLNGITQIGSIYTSLFYEADKTDASYSNNTWTWEYTEQFEGESVTFTLTAQELSNEMRWSMNVSYDGESGSYNFTMIEGAVTNDGMSGYWRFNTIDEEAGDSYPIFETTWDWESETKGEVVIEFFEGTNTIATYTFTKDGPENTISLVAEYEQNNILIYWNEQTGSGYIQEGDQSNRRCWDSSYAEVSCE